MIARFSYEHPLYTVATLRRSAELPRLARGRTAFAGASGNGFHEDGLARRASPPQPALGVAW